MKSQMRWQTLCFTAGVLLTTIGASAAQDQPPTMRQHNAGSYTRDLIWGEEHVVTAERAITDSVGASDQEIESRRRDLLGDLQYLAAARANVGDVDGALSAFGQEWRAREEFYGLKVIGNEEADLNAIDGAHAEDAVGAIAHAASSRQVVILNEAHHAPFDRILAMHLAHALKKQGFEYLACETFAVDDEHVLAQGYVSENTGWYSRESTFAKFLLEAKNDGWKFVSYEPSGPAREAGMARNLVERIFALHPKAKVFVYAGYAHAMKLPSSQSDDDKSMLAAQLLRLSGIDPLTINQTTLFAQYNSAQQTRYYQHAVKKLKGSKPAVLLDAAGKPIKLSIDKFAYDIEVVHPQYVKDPATGRPEWLSNDFTQHAIPSGLIPSNGRRVIFAYEAGSAADAVPLDVFVLFPGSKAPKAMLPKGEYVFEYEDLTTK